MSALVLERKIHRYCGRRFGGHRQVASSIELPAEDERLLASRSDLAGDEPPGEIAPYLTFFTLPASGYFALARTESDHEADRTGAVRTETLLSRDPRAAQDPFALLAGFVATDLRAELSRAQASEAPFALAPTALEPATVRELDLLAPLAELPEPTLALLLSAAEGAIPYALVGASDPVRLVRALHGMVPEHGRRDHAFCTGALAPRTFARLLSAPDLARDVFLGRAARESDLALVDLRRGQAWNVVATELAERLARSIRAGGAHEVLALVARASQIASYRSFCDLAGELRWEELGAIERRSPEESVELANHQRQRGARPEAVLDCYREALARVPRERAEWGMNVMTAGFLPVRLTVAGAPPPGEEAAVTTLISLALAEDRYEAALAFFSGGGAELYPLALDAAARTACARSGRAFAGEGLTALVGILTLAVKRSWGPVLALAELSASGVPVARETLATLVNELANVPPGERARAAAALLRGTERAGALELAPRVIERLLALADLASCEKALETLAAILGAQASAEAAAAIARAVGRSIGARPRFTRTFLATLARTARGPRSEGAGSSRTGALAVVSEAELAAVSERTGAIPSLARPRGRSRAPADPESAGAGDKPTGRFSQERVADVASGPGSRPFAPAVVAAIDAVAADLLPALGSSRAVRDHRHALAAIARVGRPSGRPDLARAPRRRALELAAAGGQHEALNLRLTLQVGAGALGEASWLAALRQDLAPSGWSAGLGPDRLVVNLLRLCEKEPVDGGAARRLAATIPDAAWGKSDLAGLIALGEATGGLPDLEAHRVSAGARTLACHERGEPEALERALAAPPPRGALAATVLTGALGERLAAARTSPGPWIDAATRTAKVASPEDAGKIALLATRLLGELQVPPGEPLAAVLLTAPLLVPHAGARARELRGALVRLGLRALDGTREVALALLARELEAAGRDPDLAREAAERTTALLASGKLEVVEAVRLGLPTLRAALERLRGGFNLKVQNGVEALAIRAAQEGEIGRELLAICLEHLKALGDSELGVRVGRRVREVLRTDDRGIKDLLAALEGARR